MPAFQWYPGHMAKAKRELIEVLPLADIVLELRDARIPLSSKNPMVDEICKNKPRLILLNKADLADKEETKKWLKSLENENVYALDIDSISGYNMKLINQKINLILKDKLDKMKAKGLVNKVIRAIVIGIPNVGKSTFINYVVKKKVAKTGDKPGVTKNLVWLNAGDNLQILDSPGILWPKFENEEVGIKLSICQGIKDEIVDMSKVVIYAIDYLKQEYKDKLMNRFELSLEDLDKNGYDILDLIARNKGFILKGNNVDYDRCINFILNDIRKNKIGAITFEKSE